MRFVRTKRFLKEYRRRSREDQERVDKALRTLSENPLHPSLHIEKMGSDIWSIRVSDRLRLTLDFVGDIKNMKQPNSVITLRNVGYHNDAYRSP